MNLYGRYVVLLSGVVETRRTLGVVESQIPNDIGSALEAAAWVSYALKSYRSELEPLPDWFVEGERHWDLVPPARVELAARERQLAYEASQSALSTGTMPDPFGVICWKRYPGLTGKLG